MKKSIFPIIVLSVVILFAYLFYTQTQKPATDVTPTTPTDRVVVPTTTGTAPPAVVIAPDLANDEIIDLSDNGLTVLPSDLLKNTNLVDLNISDNSISTLPSQIQGWINLEALRMGNNNLSAIPAEVRFFTKLATLDVSQNNLTGIPAEIGQLSNLKSLDLSDNKITEFPNEILSLTDLDTLDIRGNPVTAEHLKLLQDNLTETEILFE